MQTEAQGQAQAQPVDVEQAMLAYVSNENKREEAPKQEPQKAEQEQPEAQQPDTQPEQLTEAQQAEIRRHKLTVKNEEGKDEEVEVDDDELKRGYMKDRDYRAKTALVAREREALQAKIKEQTEPVVQQYQQSLQFFEQALWKTLAPEMQSVDWNKLAQENPAEWAAKMQAVNNVNSLLQTVKAEQQKLQEKQKEEMQTHMKRAVEESVDTLKREIPGWNNELYNSILSAGKNYGYSNEELNAVIDPRAIKVLHDAMKYRALQAAKPAVEKRVTEVPKVLKPGTAERPDANAEGFKQAMAKLGKTGRTEDAHLAALHFLKREARK